MSGLIGGVGSRSGVVGETELDHERGVFNLTISGATSGSYDLNSSYNLGQYTVIGDLCYVTGRGLISGQTSPVGELKFSLPKTSASADQSADSYFGSVYLQNYNRTDNSYFICWVNGNETVVRFVEIIDNAEAYKLSGTDLPNIWYGYSITYNI